MEGSLDLSYIESVELLRLFFFFFLYPPCCSPDLGKLFLQIIFFSYFFNFSSSSPIMCILLHLIVSHKSFRLCSLFLLPFLFAPQNLLFQTTCLWIIDFFLLPVQVCLPQNSSNKIFNSFIVFLNSRICFTTIENAAIPNSELQVKWDSKQSLG